MEYVKIRGRVSNLLKLHKMAMKLLNPTAIAETQIASEIDSVMEIDEPKRRRKYQFRGSSFKTQTQKVIYNVFVDSISVCHSEYSAIRRAADVIIRICPQM